MSTRHADGTLKESTPGWSNQRQNTYDRGYNAGIQLALDLIKDSSRGCSVDAALLAHDVISILSRNRH
jgi:hypothetical protein